MIMILSSQLTTIIRLILLSIITFQTIHNNNKSQRNRFEQIKLKKMKNREIFLKCLLYQQMNFLFGLKTKRNLHSLLTKTQKN